MPSLAGLSAGLELEPEGCFERALEMAARCRELLAERVVTAPGQATLVTFRVEGDSAEVVTKLYEAGVVVRNVPAPSRGSGRPAAGGRVKKISSA